MTIITYRNGVMAGDTIVIEGDLRVGCTTKVRKMTDGTLAGMAGSFNAVEAFFAWVEAGHLPAT